MQAVIYTRVSNLSGSRSVEDQETECRATCDRNSWPVRAVFCDDGISASRYSTKERPAWLALQAELRAGDVLVVWEASRANRDLEEFVALRNLCSALDVPLSYAGRILDLSRGDDRFMGGLDALISERESEQIKLRTQRGIDAAAAAGKPHGRPPWGYARTDHGVWEPDPVEAPRVREAVRRLLAGESQRSVFLWVRDTPGRSFDTSHNLGRAVRSPALAGLREHRGNIVKGTWEPLVSATQHERLVAHGLQLKLRHGRVAPPGQEPRHLLTGIAVCSVCGTPVRHKIFGQQRSTQIASYACPEGHCARSSGPIDKKVVDYVLDLACRINPDRYENPDPTLAGILDDIQKNKDLLAEWTLSAEKGEVSPSVFGRVEKSTLAKIAELRTKAARNEEPTADIKDLRRRWAGLSLMEKREIVRVLVQVTVLRANHRKNSRDVLIEPL